MPASIHRVALLILPLTVLGGCGQESPPPPATAALSRPLVTVITRNERVLAPRDALTERGGLPGVFVVTDGMARFRMVRAGKAADGRVEILSGLTGAEQLVTGDLRDVHDGSPITPR
jgi:hypothetical protein